MSGKFCFDLRHLYTRQKSFTLDPENAGSCQLETPVLNIELVFSTTLTFSIHFHLQFCMFAQKRAQFSPAWASSPDFFFLNILLQKKERLITENAQLKHHFTITFHCFCSYIIAGFYIRQGVWKTLSRLHLHRKDAVSLHSVLGGPWKTNNSVKKHPSTQMDASCNVTIPQNHPSLTVYTNV